MHPGPGKEGEGKGLKVEADQDPEIGMATVEGGIGQGFMTLAKIIMFLTFSSH